MSAWDAMFPGRSTGTYIDENGVEQSVASAIQAQQQVPQEVYNQTLAYAANANPFAPAEAQPHPVSLNQMRNAWGELTAQSNAAQQQAAVQSYQNAYAQQGLQNLMGGQAQQGAYSLTPEQNAINAYIRRIKIEEYMTAWEKQREELLSGSRSRSTLPTAARDAYTLMKMEAKRLADEAQRVKDLETERRVMEFTETLYWDLERSE